MNSKTSKSNGSSPKLPALPHAAIQRSSPAATPPGSAHRKTTSSAQATPQTSAALAARIKSRHPSISLPATNTSASNSPSPSSRHAPISGVLPPLPPKTHSSLPPNSHTPNGLLTGDNQAPSNGGSTPVQTDMAPDSSTSLAIDSSSGHVPTPFSLDSENASSHAIESNIPTDSASNSITELPADSSASFISLDSVMDLLSCSNCSQRFDRRRHVPKQLPCAHTFCVPCLIQLCHDSSIVCPAPCGRVLKLDSDDADSLPVEQQIERMHTNVFVFDIIDAVSKQAERQELELAASQRPQTASRPNSRMKEKEALPEDVPRCDKHRANQVSSLCSVCLHSVCSECMLSSQHKGHKMVDPTKAVSLLKTEINTLLEEAKSTPAQINSNISHLDKVVANFDKQSKVFFPEMDEFLNDTVSALQARKEQLLWQWRDRAKWEVETARQRKEIIQMINSELNATIRLVTQQSSIMAKALDKVRPIDAMTLRERAYNLLKKNYAEAADPMLLTPPIFIAVPQYVHTRIVPEAERWCELRLLDGEVVEKIRKKMRKLAQKYEFALDERRRSGQEEGPIPTNDSQAGSRVTTPAAASKPQTPSKSVTTSVSASRPTSSKPGPADVMLVHTDSGSRPSTAASHVSFAGDETFATTPAVPVFVSTLQLCSAVRVHGGVNADNLPPIEQYVGMFQTFYASVLESIDAAIGYGTGGASYVELYRTAMRHMLGIGGREDEFKGANTLREAAVDPLVVEQQKAAQAAQGGRKLLSKAEKAKVVEVDILTGTGGCIEAVYAMGVCLFHGDGVPAPQPVKALALWRAAAERGHARSMTAIGECYDNAEAELERDGTAACEWYAKAAAAQPPCAKAMFYLAERYRIGNFFDAEREARGTVKPVYEDTNPYAQSKIYHFNELPEGDEGRAQREARERSERRKGTVPKDQARALELYLRSAALEYPHSMYRAAIALELAECCSQNIVTARALLERAAASGCCPAAVGRLGIWFACGVNGFERDWDVAWKKFRAAAEADDVECKELVNLVEKAVNLTYINSLVNTGVPDHAVIRSAYISVFGDPKETPIVKQLHLPLGKV